MFIVSSIHFGKDKNNIKSIYLNDNKPYDPIFNELWFQTEKASVQGCTIMLMIGGAGKAYKELFSDFNTYYPQLKQLIMEKSWIKGIDLDIEESTSIDNVKMLCYVVNGYSCMVNSLLIHMYVYCIKINNN